MYQCLSPESDLKHPDSTFGILKPKEEDEDIVQNVSDIINIKKGKATVHSHPGGFSLPVPEQ